MAFKGQTIALTGAAAGIGAATAVLLAERGVSHLALCDVDAKGLEEVAKSCRDLGAVVSTTQVDVRREEQVSAWIDSAVQSYGKLDGAANIAGVLNASGSTTTGITSAEWDKTMDVNMKGVMHCLKAELKVMPQPGGAIVNVASAAGIIGIPNQATYCASKWGVLGLGKSAAAEFGKHGIRINSVLPGPIATSMFFGGEESGATNATRMGAGTLLRRMGRADEVAKVICFLLSDDSSYVTGSSYLVDGGYSVCGGAVVE